MNVRSAMLSLLLVGFPALAAASLEFSGYIADGPQTRFVLTDSQAQTSSGFVTIGQRFKDFVLVAFDPKQEVLTLRKNDEKLELRLKGAHIKRLNSAIMTRLTEAKEELAKLRLRYKDQHPQMQRQLGLIAQLETQLWQ